MMAQMSRKVIPFHISIGPYTSGESYPVRATFERVERLSELQLPELVLDATADLLETGELALDDAAVFGRALGRALFTPPLRELLLQSVKLAARVGGRLQLQLQIAPPELAPLPWELMTIGLARPWSPALHDDYALVRVSRGARPAAPAVVVGPLRILAVAAPGEELQLDALEVALAGQVRAGRIELRLLRDATPATLDGALLSEPVHVLHCAAPVALSERGAPRLMLRRGMETFDLLDLLSGAGDLRLVTLAGPQGDAGRVGMALPALASLLAADLPATLAFGGPLPARLSARFAAACYAELAAGAPVDLAAAAGRRALAETSGGRGWGLAQLRLAPGGEHLFAFRGRTRTRSTHIARALAIAGAGVALAAAILLGARVLGSGYSLVSSQALPAATLPTPSLPAATLATPTPTSSSLLKSLFGAAPTPIAPTVTQPPTPVPNPEPASYATYMTGPDDTLEGIAERMGSNAEAIAALNHLDPKAPLRADLPLVIPVYLPGEAGAGGLVIRRGNPAEPKVALTFDIEIDEATLYSILDILRARGLHGTFFVTGRWVMAYPNAARAIVSQGHEISNHSLTHPYFNRIGLDGAAAELSKTEKLIVEATGVSSRPYFRFPYGEYTADTVAIVARQGYVAYHWSADDAAISGWLDWAAQHKAEAQGGILLMHGRASTIAALPGWLDRLAAMGLQPTTLGDTLR
jgi:peptidoglycan/xylan/chitin deacetylase (PgdA/CDA1 family)